MSTFSAHLNMVRTKISAFAKTVFVGSSTDWTLLRHAYTTQPYCNTLDTNALINCSFTQTLEIPNNLQFVRTAWNVPKALLILACNIISGFVQLSDNIRPRYLNLCTAVNLWPLTLSFPLQLIYITSVLDIFITSKFSSQNVLKQFNKHYNSFGEGANRTISSAKASKNNCNDAIVYACR